MDMTKYRLIVPVVLLSVALAIGGCGGGGSTPTYTVTATANSGGSVSPGTQTARRGTTVTVTISVSTGYEIASVTGCGGALAGTTYTSGNIQADCTITVTFQRIIYTVSTNAGPNGSITPPSADVAHGDATVFTITPDAGYTIDAVSGCDGSLSDDQYETGAITAACTVSATFRRPEMHGTLSAQGGSGADSDVNDPNAPFASNNTLSTAQEILNPGTIGGYVAQAGEGEAGRLLLDGDEFDVFVVDLFARQLLVLEIASDDVDDDLDLYVLNSDGTIADGSIDPTSRFEVILVPDGVAGRYFIAVRAVSGASSYTFTITEPFEFTASPMRLSDSFVPGEAVVRFNPRPKAGDGYGLASRARESVDGNRRDAAETGARNTLVDLNALKARAGNEISELRRIERNENDSGQLVLAPADAEMAEKLETLHLIKQLARDPQVAYAGPNYLYEMQAFTPNDPGFDSQWHYPQIKLPEAWDLSNGNGVVVAVIDSGVLLNHPDLQGQLVAGYDFLTGTAGGNDPGQSPKPPGGSGFHGTHVAGTIAAATNNGIGVSGVAFGARLMPLRVCNTNCPGYAIEQALRFAAGLANDSGTVPPVKADVINLSLGGLGGASTESQALFDQLNALGVTVVAAAGNDATSERFYPAAYDGVIAVGAVDAASRLAPYSNTGDWIDVVAPGGDLSRDLNADGYSDGILSTHADDGSGGVRYGDRLLQGTSMAAPHVAGVIALMKAASPGITPEDIRALLQNGAITDDLGVAGRDTEFGSGMINAHKAVTQALAHAGAPVDLDPLLSAAPTAVNFGASLDTVTVVVTNAGGGSLSLGNPSENSGGWLSVDLGTQASESVLTLSATRTDLAVGTYRATVTIPSSANTVEVNVVMQVADVPDREVGFQYLLLLDADTLDPVYQVSPFTSERGQYDYRFEGLEPGVYYLMTGSDIDNDDFICDRGESCGIYRTFGDPQTIEITGSDLDNVDFSTGFRVHPSLTSEFEGADGFRLLDRDTKKWVAPTPR